MSLGVVAIIGSPNVGKSTIFNRIVGRRRAIVDDQPGVTRDRLYENAEWLDRQFRIIDTGGIEIANRPFQEQIRIQAQIAIDEADVILFVVDGKKGLSDDDRIHSRACRDEVRSNAIVFFKILDAENCVHRRRKSYAYSHNENSLGFAKFSRSSSPFTCPRLFILP